MKQPRDPEYYADIGRRGGRAGKGSPLKKASAVKAANARWVNNEKPRPLRLVMGPGILTISDQVPGLEEELRYFHWHRGEDDKMVGEYIPSIMKSGRGFRVLPQFLGRVKAFLDARAIEYKMIWKIPPAHKQLNAQIEEGIVGFSARERRALRRLLKLPAGGVCRAPEERRVEVMAAILRAYRRSRAVVVVETLKRLEEVREELQHSLLEPIGVLTSQQQERERVVVMTPGYLNSGIVAAKDNQLLIFEQLPRDAESMNVKVGDWALAPIWKMAFMGDEKLGHARLFQAEAAFGPIVDFPGGQKDRGADGDDG